MRIGQVARVSGVSVKTLRYYEDIGVLDPPERTPSGYREYQGDVLDRLAFVRAAQAVGLTLGEIREIISFRERSQVPCAHVLELIERRAVELAGRIAELKRMQTDLQALSQRGRQLDPRDCLPSRICHVIAPHPLS
jgi:MerR family copper efflux transcriptional regulator